ncbi:cation:proton antiporter, partial [Pseudomonas sp. GW460-C8]|uniref:cation:proton antiporter domain-containing protein n=1 Tax=Pseudomonas sp. GW460-C8 TaxID=2070589 RepID=UPI000CB6AA6F
LIFLLMGLRLAHRPLIAAGPSILAAVAFVTLGRAVTVYLGSTVFARTPWRLTPAHQHILVWGGLRGALALALVLGLPPD